MGKKHKQVRAIVSKDQVARVNEILERQGLGPNYIDIDADTHMAIETLVDAVEDAALELALKDVPQTKKAIEKERVTGTKRAKKKLDDVLKRTKKGTVR